LTEAQAMMDKVLRDHPNSAKAHFVDAEILSKQGRLDGAETELRTAQRLDPGLAFAKPQAVENLKAHIAAARHPAQSVQTTAREARPSAGSETPWGLIIFGIALLAAIVFFVRAMNRRRYATVMQSGPGYGFGPGGTMQPYGGGMAPPMGPMGGTMGGGMGSGIMGGLATGAAIGAGMVAGEALMHHFTDGERQPGNVAPPAPASNYDALPNDMGGSDFGVSDGSSGWDDSSSGGDGGGDWG
jgi:hypothetical protein